MNFIFGKINKAKKHGFNFLQLKVSRKYGFFLESFKNLKNTLIFLQLKPKKTVKKAILITIIFTKGNLK